MDQGKRFSNTSRLLYVHFSLCALKPIAVAESPPSSLSGEYCGELDLPTRMSGYGYHLLHTHNLSSHSPYIMPSPRRVRTVPTPRCPATILGREEACLKASPSLEGQCPFTGEGGEGIGKCALGGWVSRGLFSSHLFLKKSSRVESTRQS